MYILRCVCHGKITFMAMFEKMKKTLKKRIAFKLTRMNLSLFRSSKISDIKCLSFSFSSSSWIFTQMCPCFYVLKCIGIKLFSTLLFCL